MKRTLVLALAAAATLFGATAANAARVDWSVGISREREGKNIMPDFSTSIVSGDPVTFSPNPQNLPANSIVSWNNKTENDHQLKLSDGRVTDVIIAEQSSDEYVIGSSITYECITTDHQGETGSIDVVAVQDIPPC